MTFNSNSYLNLTQNNIKYLNCDGLNIIQSDSELQQKYFWLHLSNNKVCLKKGTIVPLHFNINQKFDQPRYFYDYNIIRMQNKKHFEQENELFVQIGFQVITLTCITPPSEEGGKKRVFHGVFLYSEAFAQFVEFLGAEAIQSFIARKLEKFLKESVFPKNRNIKQIVYFYNEEQKKKSSVFDCVLNVLKKQNQVTVSQLEPVNLGVSINDDFLGNVTEGNLKIEDVDVEYAFQNRYFDRQFEKKVEKIVNKNNQQQSSICAENILYKFKIPVEFETALPIEEIYSTGDQNGVVEWLLTGDDHFDQVIAPCLNDSSNYQQRVQPYLGICWYEKEKMENENGQQVNRPEVSSCFPACFLKKE